jgi:Protein of unknown function (DUF2752)
MQIVADEQTKHSAVERVTAAAAILIGSAFAFVLSYFNPSTAGFFPVCPFYSLTGLLCPGCGLTRGFHALFHGDVLGALHFNALAPVLFLLLAYFGASLVLIVFRGRGLSFKFLKPSVIYGFFALLLIFAVVRNLPFYPFTFLAPQ